MNKLRLLVLCAVAATGLACSTTLVPLRYAASDPSARTTPDTPLISVGAFQDGRSLGSDYGPDWLGAIRGGYGNRLKTLRTEKATSQVVEEAFADGLRSRGVFAEPGQGKYAIQGTITKLDCSEYFNLEAHVHVDVRVMVVGSNALLYGQSYQADQTEGGFGAGIFASVETLRVLAEKTLRELIDKTLDDPRLRQALQPKP